jgi:ADP-L-glycero-D-manno-heptose 6-epimerase
VQLFEGSGGFAAGEQQRDFVAVEDVVKVKLDFLDHRERSGIFNLGTGRAASFNAVAEAVVNACRRADGQAPAALAELARDGRIVYAPFPPQLVGKYQHFTQADLTALRGAGYAGEFASVEEGVARYVESLISSQQGSP